MQTPNPRRTTTSAPRRLFSWPLVLMRRSRYVVHSRALQGDATMCTDFNLFICCCWQGVDSSSKTNKGAVSASMAARRNNNPGLVREKWVLESRQHTTHVHFVTLQLLGHYRQTSSMQRPAFAIATTGVGPHCEIEKWQNWTFTLRSKQKRRPLMSLEPKRVCREQQSQ